MRIIVTNGHGNEFAVVIDGEELDGFDVDKAIEARKLDAVTQDAIIKALSDARMSETTVHPDGGSRAAGPLAEHALNCAKRMAYGVLSACTCAVEHAPGCSRIPLDQAARHVSAGRCTCRADGDERPGS